MKLEYKTNGTSHDPTCNARVPEFVKHVTQQVPEINMNKEPLANEHVSGKAKVT